MKILLINNHTKYLNDLKIFLGGICKEITIIKRSDLENNIDFNIYDLIVLSGGSDIPTVFRHKEIYQKEIEIVQNLQKPILGICLGAEIICSSFLGELYEIGKKIEGEREIDIIDEGLAECISSHRLSVFEGHHVGIKKVGDEFDIFAESSYGPEIIKHKTRPIIALQFHPEKTNNHKFNDWISLIFLFRLYNVLYMNNIKNKPHIFFYFFALFSVFLSIAIYFDVIPNINGEIKETLIYSELAGAFVLFVSGKYLESKNKAK